MPSAILVEEVSVGAILLGVLIIIATAWRTGRNNAAAGAIDALQGELAARQSTLERLGKEKDEDRRTIELQAQEIATLKARTDLTALSEQISKNTATAIAQLTALFERTNGRLDEQDKRANEREERALQRHEQDMAIGQAILDAMRDLRA